MYEFMSRSVVRGKAHLQGHLSECLVSHSSSGPEVLGHWSPLVGDKSFWVCGKLGQKKRWIHRKSIDSESDTIQLRNLKFHPLVQKSGLLSHSSSASTLTSIYWVTTGGLFPCLSCLCFLPHCNHFRTGLHQLTQENWQFTLPPLDYWRYHHLWTLFSAIYLLFLLDFFLAIFYQISVTMTVFFQGHHPSSP